MVAHDLTQCEFGGVEQATKRQSARDADDVYVSRWTDYGHDRLYLNNVGFSTGDIYVDLNEATVVADGGPSSPSNVELELGTDTLTISLRIGGSVYDLVVTVTDNPHDMTPEPRDVNLEDTEPAVTAAEADSQPVAIADGGVETEAHTSNPAADIGTIVVSMDDIVETMRLNDRDETEQHSHVLRVTPPLEGKKRATTHVSEDHTRYASDLDEKPIHLLPESFVVGHTRGSRHPDWENQWSFPSRNEARRLFRDEFDAHGDDGGTRPLTDDEQKQWDEWWSTTVETWESSVRHQVENTDELTIDRGHPKHDDVSVAVQLEVDNE